MRRKILKINKHILKEIILVLVILGFVTVGGLTIWMSTFTLPDLSTFNERQVSESTKIYDRTGKILLYDLNRGTKRTNVADKDISINVKNATVAIEDAEFYQHHGIKITSIFRAVFANIGTGGYGQGGSTITQQVIKNSLLTTEKKISRKLKEWVLAVKLERIMSKSEILNLYLNESPYGGVIYGIEEASQTYFGKSAAEVTLAEAAYLASLPNAPTYYSPYGNNKQRLEERKNLVLAKMLERGFITQNEYDQAKKEKVTWRPQENTGIKAPHFVMYVRQYLEETYGKSALEQGGLKVITTLDYGLQEKAEKMAKEYAIQNEKNFNAENLALVAMDPKTGQILTMLGSRDYFDKEIDGNFNVALAHRQPGSSFKPIVYAASFNKGYTPDTVLFDLPTEFDTHCNPDGTPIFKGDEDKCYMPVNFDGKYLGPMSLRDALAQSRNIPAIKIFYLAGLKDSLKLAKDMGIETLSNTAQYGLTLVLGGGEVSLLDMSEAYSVFAANGARNPYVSILQVTDRAGKVLEQFEPKPIQVLPEQTALMINDILSDNKARAPEFGEHSALYIESRPVAAKTGTTNDYKDAWIMGYTPNLVVGAWAGNNDNSSMQKKIAGFIVAPFWKAFTEEALKQFPVETFKKPAELNKAEMKPALAGFWQGGQAYFVNKLSGERATDFTPVELREERVVKQIHSILFWVDKNNPTGPAPISPSDDPQFSLWEFPIKKWAAEHGIYDETPAIIPSVLDSMHTPESAPVVKVLNPNPVMVYTKNQNISITIEASGRYPVSKVDYFVNNNFIGSSSRYPWNFNFDPNNFDALDTDNELRAVVYDSVLNRTEVKTNFKVNLNN